MLRPPSTQIKTSCKQPIGREEIPEKLKLLGRAITPTLKPVAEFCFPLVFRCLENFPQTNIADSREALKVQIRLACENSSSLWSNMKQFQSKNVEVMLSLLMMVGNYIQMAYLAVLCPLPTLLMEKIAIKQVMEHSIISLLANKNTPRYTVVYSKNKQDSELNVHNSMTHNPNNNYSYCDYARKSILFCSQWVGGSKLLISTQVNETKLHCLKAWISNTHPT